MSKKKYNDPMDGGEVFPDDSDELSTLDEIPAVDLSGRHIRRIVEFNFRLPSCGVMARLTGELVEVAHASDGRVYVLLTAWDQKGRSVEQFAIEGDTAIGLGGWVEK